MVAPTQILRNFWLEQFWGFIYHASVCVLFLYRKLFEAHVIYSFGHFYLQTLAVISLYVTLKWLSSGLCGRDPLRGSNYDYSIQLESQKIFPAFTIFLQPLELKQRIFTLIFRVAKKGIILNCRFHFSNILS